ncbi:tyrosine-protein phosphatase [Lactobacillus sp. M0403]|uniref:tyrosine-protein phosphatase n=1 Tax=Lactobacillus sp. M0403 TaxID=2751031 RepID=UPI0018DD6C32|nr:tyrosine-protein phosphatase [Lactobacillus sp. M0403]MBI0093430.1 tyrosine-protein phosphatase [Lactobacillus sp. M0403]
MTAPIVLPIKSVRNPRDIGGYVGSDGRKIRTHRLLRTGNISEITPADEQYLLDYGLRTIIDLRSPAECKQNPDKELDNVEHYACPLSAEDNTGGHGLDMSKEFAEYRKDQYAGFKLMCRRYHHHILSKSAKQSFHHIIELIAENDDGAILYHCSEGKDRTGLVTIIILYILGVDMEVIRQDYLYSNYMLNDYRAVRDQHFKQVGENDNFRANMRVLGSVANSYFDTSLITINKNFGGLDSYITNELEIDDQMQELIREKYLEK